MKILGLILFFCAFGFQNASADYCAFKKGNEWVYSGAINGEPAEFIQVIETETNQEKGTVYVLASRINGIVINTYRYYLDKEALYLTGQISHQGETIYHPPRKEMLCYAKVGDKWKWRSDNMKDYLEFAVIREEKVRVPAGEFNTIVLKTRGFIEGVTINDAFCWFSFDIGTVKEVVNASIGKMTRELVKYHVK